MIMCYLESTSNYRLLHIYLIFHLCTLSYRFSPINISDANPPVLELSLRALSQRHEIRGPVIAVREVLVACASA
jgi:hypothetical protein